MTRDEIQRRVCAIWGKVAEHELVDFANSIYDTAKEEDAKRIAKLLDVAEAARDLLEGRSQTAVEDLRIALAALEADDEERARKIIPKDYLPWPTCDNLRRDIAAALDEAEKRGAEKKEREMLAALNFWRKIE